MELPREHVAQITGILLVTLSRSYAPTPACTPDAQQEQRAMERGAPSFDNVLGV